MAGDAVGALAGPAPASIGFAGLGLMGEPMARNLVRAGAPLVVWNRTPERSALLAAEGAAVAGSVAELFARCRVVLLMLADAAAVDAVLGRGTPAFTALVRDRTVVHLGTTAPGFSRALHDDVLAAGGRYVEAPVSGSRAPAEAGRLVAMVAGGEAAVAEVTPWLTPLSAAVVPCGAVPNATLMKLAVNSYLNGMFAALTEARNFAACAGLDLGAFLQALLAGPLASDLVRVKTPKLIARDFTPQTAIADVHANTGLIIDAAREIGAAVPISEACRPLYAAAAAAGTGREDVVSLVRAFEALGARGSAPRSV